MYVYIFVAEVLLFLVSTSWVASETAANRYLIAVIIATKRSSVTVTLLPSSVTREKQLPGSFICKPPLSTMEDVEMRDANTGAQGKSKAKASKSGATEGSSEGKKRFEVKKVYPAVALDL